MENIPGSILLNQISLDLTGSGVNTEVNSHFDKGPAEDVLFTGTYNVA